MQKRIVALGAGFGGVYAARRLRGACAGDAARTILISRDNYFLFTPLLHEVATGSLTPTVIVEPLRKVLARDTELLLGDVLRVRTADKVVETSAGDVPYDVLIVALGSVTDFFGVTGAEENSYTLKSLTDAIAIKRCCIDVFEKAALCRDKSEKERMLTFAIVGGGATGVELAAELAEFAGRTLAPSYRPALDGAVPRIMLFQQGPELLPRFSAPVRRKALETLRKKGVDVRLEAAVNEVGRDAVTLASGERFPVSTILWVAGVKPAAIAFDRAVERDRVGRLVVDETLRLKGAEDVFAIGDIASTPAAGSSEALPPFAQVGIAEAAHAARNVGKLLRGERLDPFVYRHRGHLVSLGQWMAVAEIGPVRFWGQFAWWLWRTVYLTKFISIRKKFLIALQWTINLFSQRDVTRI